MRFPYQCLSSMVFLGGREESFAYRDIGVSQTELLVVAESLAPPA